MGSTQNVILDTSQYVKANVAPGYFLLQSHADTVRIAFSDAQPLRSNTAFHELGGQAGVESVLPISYVETFVWVLALTTSSRLSITQLNMTVPVSIKEPNEPNGSIPVTLQDQTTPTVMINPTNILAMTTLAADVAIYDKTITVASTAGITTDQKIALFSLETNRYYYGEIITIVANDILLDSPVDSVFKIGDTVSSGLADMNVDGSVTPQIFSFRGGDPGIDLTVDITRIMFSTLTNGAPNYNFFGDIPALLNGVLMRSVTGETHNIFNIKTNADTGGMCYDYRPFDPMNPSGVYGNAARLTFAGQNKMGVVIRVKPGENIEFLIQDDLSALLSFKIMVQGSLVI